LIHGVAGAAWVGRPLLYVQNREIIMGESVGQIWDGTIDFFFNGGPGGVGIAWWDFVTARVPDLRAVTFNDDHSIVTCHVAPVIKDGLELQKISLPRTYEWIERVIHGLIDADMKAPGTTMEGHLAGVMSYAVRRLTDGQVADREQRIMRALRALGLVA
jgi:hypothetical protein